jgi:hypothetical protein
MHDDGGITDIKTPGQTSLENRHFCYLLLAIDNRYQYSGNQQDKACCGRRAKFLFIFILLLWSKKPVAAPPRNWLCLLIGLFNPTCIGGVA